MKTETVESNNARLAEIRAKLLEALDLTTTWEEAEKRKKMTTEPLDIPE